MAAVPTATRAERVHAVAALVVRAALARPPTLGRGRLVCVDGPAGSGKTTLARAVQVAARGSSTALVHLDDLLDGWAGLSRVAASLERHVLRPLAQGRAGRYRRYDWVAGRFAEEHTVPPVDLLVVDGVGSGARSYADLVTTLVWVEAPADLRVARGLARDGEALRPQWEAWMADEDRHLAAERTRERADVRVYRLGDPEQSVRRLQGTAAGGSSDTMAT